MSHFTGFGQPPDSWLMTKTHRHDWCWTVNTYRRGLRCGQMCDFPEFQLSYEEQQQKSDCRNLAELFWRNRLFLVTHLLWLLKVINCLSVLQRCYRIWSWQCYIECSCIFYSWSNLEGFYCDCDRFHNTHQKCRLSASLPSYHVQIISK